MAIEDDLIKVGLKSKEAQAYLALLALGPATVVALSKKAGLKRATVYEILKSLIERGLATETTYGKRKRYLAESPEKFFMIKMQESETLRKMLPTLEALRNVAIEKPMIQFFQGKEALKQIFEDLCLKTDPIDDKLLAIETKAGVVADQLGLQFFIDLLKKKKERGLDSLTLDTFSKEELDEFTKQYPWSVEHRITIKLIDDPKNLFNVSIYLYQNKIALIAADQLIALVIENQRLKKSFELLFYTLWASAKPTKYKN